MKKKNLIKKKPPLYSLMFEYNEELFIEKYQPEEERDREEKAFLEQLSNAIGQRTIKLEQEKFNTKTSNLSFDR